ncbi:MAG TPA: hypothetical protein VII87_04755 [Solirubrobacteraceae bacterium]
MRGSATDRVVTPRRGVRGAIAVSLAVGWLTVCGLAVAGCGASAPAKRDVIARGNAICLSALRAVRSQPPPSAAGSLPALADYLKRVVPIVDKEVAAVRALPRPAHDRALLDRYVSALTATGAEYRTLAAAAARGDRSAVAQALAALRASTAAPAAARYGLSDCAGSGATVT